MGRSIPKRAVAAAVNSRADEDHWVTRMKTLVSRFGGFDHDDILHAMKRGGVRVGEEVADEAWEGGLGGAKMLEGERVEGSGGV